MTKQQRKNSLRESPSQTAGPFVHIGENPNFIGNHKQYETDLGAALINEDTIGERISISGKVIDGEGNPLLDAVVEIWHADGNGIYPAINEHRGTAIADFTGWGRCPCDFENGEYTFDTIKPGQVIPDGNTTHAPHISFWIVARGINIGLHTRMYFADEEDANAADPLLNAIDQKTRIATLLAQKIDGNDHTHYRFDIRLQGENETIFLDI